VGKTDVDLTKIALKSISLQLSRNARMEWERNFKHFLKECGIPEYYINSYGKGEIRKRLEKIALDEDEKDFLERLFRERLMGKVSQDDASLQHTIAWIFVFEAIFVVFQETVTTETTFFVDTRVHVTCFPAGTKIAMADGTYRAIERVSKGDLVKAFDERNGRITTARVVRISSHRIEDPSRKQLIFINRNLKITPDHLVYTNRNWKAANMLKRGDIILNLNEGPTTVKSIEKLEGERFLFNLETLPHHNFFADDILVHNDKHQVILSLIESVREALGL